MSSSGWPPVVSKNFCICDPDVVERLRKFSTTSADVSLIATDILDKKLIGKSFGGAFHGHSGHILLTLLPHYSNQY